MIKRKGEEGKMRKRERKGGGGGGRIIHSSRQRNKEKTQTQVRYIETGKIHRKRLEDRYKDNVRETCLCVCV